MRVTIHSVVIKIAEQRGNLPVGKLRGTPAAYVPTRDLARRGKRRPVPARLIPIRYDVISHPRVKGGKGSDPALHPCRRKDPVIPHFAQCRKNLPLGKIVGNTSARHIPATEVKPLFAQVTIRTAPPVSQKNGEVGHKAWEAVFRNASRAHFVKLCMDPGVAVGAQGTLHDVYVNIFHQIALS